MKKKVLIGILSFVSAVVLFFITMQIQSKIINPSGNSEVYFAVRTVKKNTVLDSSNIGYYFQKKTTSRVNLVSSPIENIRQLAGKYVTQDIIQGQQVSSLELQDNSKRLKEIDNPVDYNLKTDDISQTVGGTLREGDVIDLIFTQSSSQNEDHKTVTEVKLNNLIVEKAFTTDGRIVTREDGNKYAASLLTLKLSAKDAATLDNEINRGKVKAVKVDDNSKTPYIKVEN